MNTIETMAICHAEKFGIIDFTTQNDSIVYREGNNIFTTNLLTNKTTREYVYTPFNNHAIQPNTKVKVYYNLHKKCFSIMDYKTKRVIAHAMKVKLTNCEFQVNQKGRERVLRENKKNVHAFVIGTLDFDVEFGKNTHNRSAYYNPYQWSTFVDDNGLSLLSAKSVICENKKITFYK